MHLSTHKWVEDAIRLTHYCKPAMSLSRRRRRKQGQRRHNEARPAPVDGLRDGEASRLAPERLFELQRALDESHGSTPEGAAGPRDVDEGPLTVPSSSGLHEARRVERLAYTRLQAAEALGVSISTIDRRIVPAIETVKLPWGQRLIPVDELRRFLRNHRQPAHGCAARRAAGRPATLPRSVVERIRLEYARGRGLSEIARALRTRASRQRTAVGSGGPRQCAPFSSAQLPFRPRAPSARPTLS